MMATYLCRPAIAATVLTIFCTPVLADSQLMKIEESAFGKTPDGETVTKYTLTNAHGHSVGVMNWGASLLDVNVPDRDGVVANVNAAFDSLELYVARHPYFGSTVGRFCNRIGNAQFTIDGVSYELDKNHGEHQLHGGKDNFSHKFWTGQSYQSDDTVGVKFTLTSPDGDMGFPGTVTIVCDYAWNNKNELTVGFSATTDKATHVNLTNHSYWNLAGIGSGSAMEHVAEIHSDQILDVDTSLIPTGKLNDLTDTVFDFRTPTTFAARVDELPATKGYDHCYVVRGNPGDLRLAAKVTDPSSGRTLEIETTQPGVQLYTANHLAGNDSSAGIGGHEAFCLETQHYPDAPNKPSFPSTLLKPGDTLSETTVHRFGVE